MGKKKTVRSARLSCARRIPFSPPIFPRNGSKLHQAPLPSGSGGGRAGRRPAPCSARAQPLLTPLLAEPPLGSSCALLCPQPFWMHLHLPWHHQAVHKDEVLVEQRRDAVPAAPLRAGALHTQRGQAAPSPRAEAPRDACTPAAPSPGGGGCCFLAPGPAGAGWRPGAGGEAEKKGWRRALRGHGAETSLRRHVLVLERAEGPQPAGCLRARAVPALAQRWPSEPQAESSQGCKGIRTPIKPCSTRGTPTP